MSTRPGAANFANIQERRKHVINLWAHGLNMREIADKLDIHVSMVSRDIRIWRKQHGLPPLSWGSK